MSNFSRKAVAVGLALTTAAWLAGAVLPASAQTSAATIATLMAQIQALQAQLTALQGGSTGSSVTASYNYTRDLTVGSQGADVTALQQMLVAQGDLSMPAGVAYGYFGGLTKAALAKYQAANGIKPASGFFGPITRAYVAAHTSSTGTGTGTTGTGTVVPTGSGLAVSLASTNPVGTNIATGAVNQKMLSLNFTAGSQAVTVTSLQLVRGGLSQDSDLLNVYLYQGGQRLATNMGISNGVVNFNQASGLFTVPAGQTVTIDVTADIANASNTGHIITLSLASATSVTASAQVSGSFPITGNAMTIANVTLASLNFTNSSVGTSSASAVNVNAGQTHNVVGTFTLQAGSDPVKISSIRFTEAGSIPTQYLQNIQLWNGSTQVGGTLQTMNGNIAYFDLSSAPLMLAAGQTAALTLYADVTAGVGYYFQFTIQQSSDIQAVDTMYNVGIGATAVTYGTSFPQNMTYMSVQNGGLVITPASSSQIYVVSNNTNSVLGSFNVLASGDNIRVQDVKVGFSATSTLQNVQVFLNGAQIGTTQSTLTNTTLTNGYYVLDIPNLNYVIPMNANVPLTVQATVTGGSTIGTEVYIQGQQTSNYATVTGGYVSAPNLQVLGSGTNLTAYANPSYGNPTINAGTSPAEIASFILQAGQVNSVTFAGVTLMASTTNANDLSNLYIKVAGQPFGTTIGSVSNGGSYGFTGSPVTINPNGTLEVDVYGTLGLNATENAPFVTLTGVNATAGNNAVSLASTVTGQTVTVTPGAALQSSNVALDPNSMATTTLGMGQNGLTLGTFRLTATSTPITVTELDFLDGSSTSATSKSPATGTFTSLQLVVAGQTTPLYTLPGFNGTTGMAAFTLLTPLTVPQNGYVSLNLVGSIPSYNSYSASEGLTHYIWLTKAVSQVASGASSTQFTSSTASHTNGITVYKTTPTAIVGSNSLPSGVSAATTVSGGGYVGVFNVTAGSGGDVYVKSFTMQQSGNMVTSTTAVNYSFYPYVNGSVQPAVASVTLTGNNASSTVNATSSSATGWDVPAGTTVPLLVKVTNNPTTVTQTSNVAFTVSMTGSFTWNDGVGSDTTSVPSTITFPQNSSVVSATN